MFELQDHVSSLAAHAGYQLSATDLPRATSVDPDQVAVVLGAAAGSAVIATLTQLMEQAVTHPRHLIEDLADEPASGATLRQAATYLAWLLGDAAADLETRRAKYHQMLTGALDHLAHAGAVDPLTDTRQIHTDLHERMAQQLRDLLDECAAAWGHRVDWVTATHTLGPRLGDIHALLDAVAGLAATHSYQQLLAHTAPGARAELAQAPDGDTDALAAAATRLAAITTAWEDSLRTQAEHNRTVLTHLPKLAKRARLWQRERWRRTPPLRAAAHHAT